MDIKEHIIKAFAQIDSMPVTGMNQERAALAKTELNIALQLIEKEERNESVSAETPVQG